MSTGIAFSSHLAHFLFTPSISHRRVRFKRHHRLLSDILFSISDIWLFRTPLTVQAKAAEFGVRFSRAAIALPAMPAIAADSTVNALQLNMLPSPPGAIVLAIAIK